MYKVRRIDKMSKVSGIPFIVYLPPDAVFHKARNIKVVPFPLYLLAEIEKIRRARFNCVGYERVLFCEIL